MKKFRPGVTFGDFVVTDAKTGRVRGEKKWEVDYRRGFVIWLGVVVAFGVLLVRAVDLQVYLGARYRILADENRIKRIKEPAQRGKLVDRFGKIIGPGEETAHVAGYLGEVQADEVGLLRPSTTNKLEVGDMVGRTGAQQVWDEQLRGQDGGRLVEVDSGGKEVRELGKQAAVAGEDVKLTLDLELQQEAYLAMKGYRGAVVVSNPKSGEILALVSTPSFDPNKISAQYTELRAQKDMPFLNRAIGGIYPPGSTFKIVTTTAAISEGRVKPSFTYEDKGVVTVGDFKYLNWFFSSRGGVEGVIGFKRAIARSTDTFFYKVGEQTGPEAMAKWARKFGLGEKTGIEIAGEVEGLVATPEWKERVKHEKWFLGNTYHLAIGQGDTLVTPIQVNLMTNVIAAKGRKCKLHLLKSEIRNPKSETKESTFGSNDQMLKCSNVEISDEILDIVHKGLLEACSEGGTAYPFFEWNKNQDKKVACKTGTAEYVKENGKTGTHAWLTAYAPAEDPAVSVTVLVEGGGEGSRTAAPVARKVLAKYFGIEDKFDYQRYVGGGE